jgi:hypothetical protein
MITQANAKPVQLQKHPERPPDELIRLLVSFAGTSDLPRGRDADEGPEEVLLDLDVDGARYILMRLPKADSPRV